METDSAFVGRDRRAGIPLHSGAPADLRRGRDYSRAHASDLFRIDQQTDAGRGDHFNWQTEDPIRPSRLRVVNPVPRKSVPMNPHITDLVLLTHAGKRLNRRDLAIRWNCSIRNVSAVIAVARVKFGVVLESHKLTDGTHAYGLASYGNLQPSSMTRARKAR